MAVSQKANSPPTILDEQRHQIRLLVIEPTSDPSHTVRCHHTIHNLETAPKYEALSYCWGEVGTQATIELNGLPFLVRPNLYHALQHLRSRNDLKKIWIDAICINQDDVLERNSQVKLMRRIYKNADRVLVWLGVEAENSSRGIQLIHSWSQVSTDNVPHDLSLWKQHPVMFHLDAFEAIEKIMDRSWWTRVWVYQEYVFAREVWFQCGDHDWSAASLARAFTNWHTLYNNAARYNLEQEHHMCLGKASANKFTVINCHHVYVNTGEEMLGWEHMTNLVDILHMTHAYDATDPRDKLFSLLGFDDQSSLIPPPDYQVPVAHLYTDFAVRCLLSSHAELSILHLAGIGYDTTDTRLECASWVPDLRSSTSIGISFKHMGFTAGGLSNPNFSLSTHNRILSCEGVIVDKIAQVIAWPSDPPAHVSMGWIDAVRHLPNDHPKGVPLMQILFRTLILDATKYDDALTYFENAESRISFFKYLVGFILLFGTAQLIRTQLAGEENNFLAYVQQIVQAPILETYFSFLYSDSALQPPESFLERCPRRGLFRETEAAQWSLWLDEAMGGHTVQQDKNLAFVLRFNRRLAKAKGARALIVTDQGYIGLGPSYSKVGDQVCCISGCETPFVLRPVGNNHHFQLVGQSYVYGIMHGEMFEGSNEAAPERQNFDII